MNGGWWPRCQQMVDGIDTGLVSKHFGQTTVVGVGDVDVVVVVVVAVVVAVAGGGDVVVADNVDGAVTAAIELELVAEYQRERMVLAL